MVIVSMTSIVHFLLTKEVQVLVSLPKANFYIRYFFNGVDRNRITIIFLNLGIQRLGSNKTSLTSAIGPVSTIVLAWVFLGEPIAVMQ
jgi:drug/metabolite transporter (DMT)-like permease